MQGILEIGSHKIDAFNIKEIGNEHEYNCLLGYFTTSRNSTEATCNIPYDFLKIIYDAFEKMEEIELKYIGVKMKCFITQIVADVFKGLLQIKVQFVKDKP